MPIVWGGGYRIGNSILGLSFMTQDSTLKSIYSIKYEFQDYITYGITTYMLFDFRFRVTFY